MANQFFQRVFLRAYDTDTGVEGQTTPLVSALPTVSQIAMDVSALNFRLVTETTDTDYVGGYHYSTRKSIIKCDLIISKLIDTFDYPDTPTTVEAFYSSWWAKAKYHWLIFDVATATYNLPPDMVTAIGATQEAWACNLHLNEPEPDPANGSYVITGYLTAIKDS